MTRNDEENTVPSQLAELSRHGLAMDPSSTSQKLPEVFLTESSVGVLLPLRSDMAFVWLLRLALTCLSK